MDRLELVEKLMWTGYEKEKSPSKRVGILQAIVSMQPYIFGYYDATTYVLSKRLKTDMIGASKPELGSLELKKFQSNNDSKERLYHKRKNKLK